MHLSWPSDFFKKVNGFKEQVEAAQCCYQENGGHNGFLFPAHCANAVPPLWKI